MIALGICSHGFQLSGRDRGELGVLFSDDVISLEELLKENLKIKQKISIKLVIIPIFKFIKPIYNCKDLLGKPKIFVIQEGFKKIYISKILCTPLFHTHPLSSTHQFHTRATSFQSRNASVRQVSCVELTDLFGTDAFVWK